MKFKIVNLDYNNLHLKKKRSKETYRRKAAQLLKEGRANEARECFQRCIECTPKMALEVIQVNQLR